MSDYDTADVYTNPDDYGPYETCNRLHTGALDPLLLADPAWAVDALDRLEHCACDEGQAWAAALIGACTCTVCLPAEHGDAALRAQLGKGVATGMFTALKPHYRITHDGPHGFRRVIWSRSLELSRLLAYPPLRLATGEHRSDNDFARWQVAELLEHLKFTETEDADRDVLRAAARGTA